MRKTDFVSYRIPSESEWKDVRSAETGLSSWVREPILIICTRLDFRPHSVFLASSPQKTTIHFFSRQLFPHPSATANRERTGNNKQAIKMNTKYSLSYNISVSAFMAFRNTPNEDSSRCSLPFLHSCQTGLKTRPTSRHLDQSTFWR